MRMISIFLAGILAAQATPRTAREYYNEIYAAGGLDRMADVESTPANDPWLRKAVRLGFDLVLRRPIETARLTRLLRLDRAVMHGVRVKIAATENQCWVEGLRANGLVPEYGLLVVR
jgi:hypothetical protein